MRSKAKDEADLEKEDKKVEKPEQSFHIGECQLEEIEFEKSAKDESFTKVELYQIREDVQRQISGTGTSRLLPAVEQQRSYSAAFENILKLPPGKRSSKQQHKNRKSKSTTLKRVFL